METLSSAVNAEAFLMPTLSDIKLCEPMNEGLWGGGGSWGGSGSRAAESGQVHRLVRSPPFLNARSQRSRTKERLQIRGHKGASVLGASQRINERRYTFVRSVPLLLAPSSHHPPGLSCAAANNNNTERCPGSKIMQPTQKNKTKNKSKNQKLCTSIAAKAASCLC